MENQKNYVDSPGMPLGLGMALAQNAPAMSRFAALTEGQKQRIIEHTHQIGSREEMAAYAQQIADGSIG